MPSDGFSQNFIRAYALGSEAKTRKERLRLEEEQQAFQRQQAILQLQRIEEDRKIAAVGRGQQDVLSQLKLSEQAPRLTVALPEGQPGPPAPAEVTPLQFPTYGGKSIPVTPRFREDVMAAERAQQDMEIQGAVQKAEALAPTQIAVERAKGMIELPEGMTQRLGLPRGPVNKEVVNTAEVLYSQSQQNARQAKELEAEAKKRKDEEPPQEFLQALLDSAQHRTLDLRSLGVKGYNALQKYAALKGEKVPRQFTDSERVRSDRARIGLASVMDMERLYNEDPNVLKAAAIPTSFGRKAGELLFQSPHAEEFETARKRAMDPELRLATGAALNKGEQVFYGELQASLFNDPEAVQYKMNQLKALYAGVSGLPITIKMPDGKEFKVADPDEFQAREKMRHAIRQGGQVFF